MHVIEDENVVCFDVDDTLVMWNSKCVPTHKIDILCPYSNSFNFLKPHMAHIDLLKKYKGRGLTVVVWSAGGYKWAEAVVKALELEAFVDYVMTKPSKIVDDLMPNEIFTTRIYLKDEE